MTSDLQRRLRLLRVEVAADTEERHLRSIAAVLAANVSAPPPRRRPRRRWLVVVAAATLLSLPIAALGAEGAVPGDALYPVKRAVEWVRSAVDRDVRATHRVEELEILIDRGAPAATLRDRLADAERIIPGSDVDLQQRLDAARRRVAGTSDAATTTTTTTTTTETTTTSTTSTTTSTTTTVTDDGERSGDRHDRGAPTDRG